MSTPNRSLGKPYTPKVMKLVDGSTGLMRCRVCGAEHHAALKHGGGYKRGSWQCVNACKRPAAQPAPAVTTA
jgi:hypothetical protein